MAYAATTRTNGAIRNPYVLLAIAGAFFLVTQLTLFSLHRAASWDEAIYLSQVDPELGALRFAASRARGIVLLVAPPSLGGAGLDVIRTYLTIASSAMLVVAYACWVPLLRATAALAAALFATTWVALFYGGEVMPNLWSALLITATLGIALRPSTPGRPVLAAGFIAAAALLRPPDAVVATAVIAVLLGRRGEWRATMSTVGGCLVGILPWVVEMSARFGGPVRAIAAAMDVGHVRVGGWESIRRHLDMTDGPTTGSVPEPSVAIAGIVWWLGLCVLCAVGASAATSRVHRSSARTGIVAGLALAAPYVLAVSEAAPRFLLPAYAVLAIPSAVGVTTVWSRRRVLPSALLLAGVLWVGWNLRVADRVEAAVAQSRDNSAEVGRALQTLAEGKACALVSSDNFPQIALASRCEGLPSAADPDLAWLAGHGEDGARFVLTRGDQSPGGGSRELHYLLTLDADWRVYALGSRTA